MKAKGRRSPKKALGKSEFTLTEVWHGPTVSYGFVAEAIALFRFQIRVIIKKLGISNKSAA